MRAQHNVVPNGPAKASTRPKRICMHVLGTARVDARVIREAATLVQAGYDVTIVDVEPEHRAREEMIHGVRIRHIVMPSWFVPTRVKPFFVFKAAWMTLRGATAVTRVRADSYHAHDENALPACSIAARLRRKKLVFDAHELPLTNPAITRWRTLTALSRNSLRRMLRRTSAVITVSPPIGVDLQQRYGGPPATLVRNIPVYHPPITSNRIRERLGFAETERIALYQGYFLEDRQLDRLVRAARFLEPHHHIVLMGKGVMQKKLEALINQEQVGDRVHIAPHAPYEELLEWTASADIGLVLYPLGYSPSVDMCLPNKLFEYLMAGLPVLATPLQAVSALITQYGVGRITASLAPADLGQAISEILGDDEALARYSANALAATKQDLCWEQEKLHLLSLYDEVLGNASAQVKSAQGLTAGAAPVRISQP
jgi:glycosyltransferase involved in cell wall biosynthesis